MPVGDQRPVVPRRRHRPRRRVRRRARVRVPERLVRGEAEVVQHPRIGGLQDGDRVPHLRRRLRDISGPGRGSQRLPHPRPLVDDRREVRERVVFGHLVRVVGGAGQVVQLAEVVVDAGGLEPQHRRHFRLALHHRRLQPGGLLGVAVGQARVSLERVREGPVRLPVRRDGLHRLAATAPDAEAGVGPDFIACDGRRLQQLGDRGGLHRRGSRTRPQPQRGWCGTSPCRA